jgi:hypothetical protein
MADENTTPEVLTAEYCKSFKQRIAFRTGSLEEAAFVARQLQNLGFRFYSDHANKLQVAVGGCVYLDGDKTIMVSSELVPSAKVFSLDNFSGIFAQDGAAKGARLTAEDVKTRKLVFYPHSFSESYRAVSVLAALGAAPGLGNASLAALTAHGVNYGLVVQKGQLSAGPVAEDLEGARICTMGDFGMPLTTEIAQPDNRALLSAFNEVSAQLRKMEARLAAVEEQLKPDTIDKSTAKKLLEPPHG